MGRIFDMNNKFFSFMSKVADLCILNIICVVCKQAKENGMKKVQENEKILLDGLSETELCLLRRMLEQITENIDKIPGTSGKMTQRK